MPGTGAPLEFAPSHLIEQHEALARDFLGRVLDLNYDECFISDQSSLWDFHQHDSNDALSRKISDLYGVDRRIVEPADNLLEQGSDHVLRDTIPALVLLAVALQASYSTADDWPGPVTLTRFSDDGGFFARIVPGKSVGDTVGFAGAPKGDYAHARLYALQRDGSYRLTRDAVLLNPVAPVDAVINKHGYLITLDNWHNLGYGKVLAVYDPSGRMVRSYELEELYTGERIKNLRESASSRYWRCAPSHFVDPAEQTQLYIREALGGYFVLTITSGAVAYHAGNIAECVPPELPRR